MIAKQLTAYEAIKTLALLPLLLIVGAFILDLAILAYFFTFLEAIIVLWLLKRVYQHFIYTGTNEQSINN